MGVQAVVAVVPQHPEMVGWNRHLQLPVGHGAGCPGLPQGLAVALQVAVVDSDPVTGAAHNPLDQRLGSVVAHGQQAIRRPEHHHVTQSGITTKARTQFIHQQQVPHL